MSAPPPYPIFAGIDVGSITAEAVILDGAGSIQGSAIIRVRPRVEQSAREAMAMALEQTGLGQEQIDLCFSTGYGRDSIAFSSKNISEISCHGRGAHHLAPDIRTVLDVGGQDCKVVRLDADGNLDDFAMNDKCAAGTGRFLEMMARTLSVDISELGPLALRSKRPLSLSSQCTIFCEMEVMQLLYGGEKKADIAAGVHAALVRRIKALATRVGLHERVCITGGGSKNAGLVAMLERDLDVRFQPLAADPQIVGALGAALFARDAWERRWREALA